MMIVVEVVGAVASALTIFSAGVAVGRFIERNKNDRQVPGKIRRSFCT